MLFEISTIFNSPKENNASQQTKEPFKIVPNLQGWQWQ